MTLMESMTLFGIMVVLAALPSSSVALVIARAASLGSANGIAVAVGVVLGDLVFVALAVAGLSIVAETFGGLFVLVKIAGGLYLIWFGIKLLTSKAVSFQASSNAPRSRGLAASLLAGFVLTLGDIKAILFYASLFPVFVDLNVIGNLEIAAIVSITILSVGGVKVAYALLGDRVGGIASRHKLGGACRKTAGGLMVGTGSYLIFQA